MPGGVGAARWICVGRVAGHNCEILHLRVEMEKSLPIGWGVLGMRGDLVSAEKAVGQMQYFGPRDKAVKLSGIGDVLLTR